ncbi:MAG: branched-chain amino acid ABC transporter permease [Alphaproteobacteria bacterium]|nr:branched-chain amino acid ABC transporter permease [Alphaproteobacteria bacterium]
MNSILFLQTLLNALMLAGLYVMTATGLSLVLGVLHIINFAHGAFLMFGAYLVWMLVDKETTAIENVPEFLRVLDIPYPLAAIMAVIAIGALGALVNRVLYQRFWGKVLPCLIVAVGLTQIMQQGAFVTFGIHTKSVPTYFEGLVDIFGARFPLERLMIIVVAVLLTTGLLLLLRYTRTGLAMRAVAQDSDAAAVSGVNIPRTATIAMFIGCGMAAAAAAVIAPVFTVHAYMAEGYLIKAFMVIILGGMGSITGAIWAGILVGFIDAFGNVFFGYFTQIILLALVVGVIVFKPTGLFSGIVFDVFTREE